MPNAVVRKVELFAIHAHLTHSTEVDYTKIFEDLKSLSAQQRVVKREYSAFAIGDVRKLGSRYFFEVFEGPIGVGPLIFALDTATAHTSTLERDEIVADITHVMVDSLTRRASIEYVRKDAKADYIAFAIPSILSAEFRHWRTLDIEFAPIVMKDFIDLISDFERIREADITITRPNASWTDHYTAMSSVLEESNGDTVDLSVRAGRNKALTRNRGIIQLVRDVVNDAQPYLKKAAIKGTRRGEEGETTLSTNKHVAQAVGRITQDRDGRLSSVQLQELMTGLLNANPPPASATGGARPSRPRR